VIKLACIELRHLIRIAHHKANVKILMN